MSVVREFEKRPGPGAETVANVAAVMPPIVAAVVLGSNVLPWQIWTEEERATPEEWRRRFSQSPCSSLVYVPRCAPGRDLTPDVQDARVVLTEARRAGVSHLVLISSSAVYGATCRHAGLATERAATTDAKQGISGAWLELESLATSAFNGHTVTVLRAAPMPIRGGGDFYSRLFSAKVVFSVAGHDPTLQFLSPLDLAAAVHMVLEGRCDGVFNIVPASPVPLHAALREAVRRVVPMPWWIHTLFRTTFHRSLGVASSHQLQFARYHLTASGDKAANRLGFVARYTSMDAIRQVQIGATDRVNAPIGRREVFDPFGLDRRYIEKSWRRLMGFLYRRYWRVETRGLEHVPRSGGAVLVGMHRGFMPFDGVLTLLTVSQGSGRIPRFLIHPGLLKFPVLFNLMSKFGGVVACAENADRVLGSGELLGVYPEGIRGAFSMYRRAHRIAPSWRDDCIAFALRHRVPIVPFVTVGTAEIFPILGRINSRWWKRYAEWPFIPITPTFPFIPVPLPSKWHTSFLEPIHIETRYGPEAADDPAVVRAISAELRRRMEVAYEELRGRRRSIFAGSLFNPSEA
jgi:1-acyl-sn-glycerol-3-phosphate acyltransferase/nucleoside-diphosphate-sugar epimerase